MNVLELRSLNTGTVRVTNMYTVRVYNITRYIGNHKL